MTSFTHDSFLAEIRRRGAGSIRRVVFRHNRTRLLSISRDRVTLNAHACFLAAPPEILDAVARFVTADPRTAAHRRAVAALREWPGVEDGLSEARARRPARRSSRPVDCCASPEQRAFLCDLYAQLNEGRFAGRLPTDLPLRVSARMARRLGQVRFDGEGMGADAARGSAPAPGAPPLTPAGTTLARPAGARRVLDLALSADLFVEGNDRELLDTMLHEMAHVEAYLLHGHKGHGAAWKTVARRVGCEARACTRRRIHRRRRGAPVPQRVPRVPGLGAAAPVSRPGGAGRPPASARPQDRAVPPTRAHPPGAAPLPGTRRPPRRRGAPEQVEIWAEV